MAQQRKVTAMFTPKQGEPLRHVGVSEDEAKRLRQGWRDCVGRITVFEDPWGTGMPLASTDLLFESARHSRTDRLRVSIDLLQ